MIKIRCLGVAAAIAVVAGVPVHAEAPAPASELRIAGPVLMVADIERSLRFYTEGLGFTLSRRLQGNPGPGATVVGKAGDQSPFLLLRQRGGEPSTAPAIEIGNGLSRIMLNVADAKAVEARLRKAGYSPGTLNARNIFFVRDPDGYNYEVMQSHGQ